MMWQKRMLLERWGVIFFFFLVDLVRSHKSEFEVDLKYPVSYDISSLAGAQV